MSGRIQTEDGRGHLALEELIQIQEREEPVVIRLVVLAVLQNELQFPRFFIQLQAMHLFVGRDMAFFG